MNRDPWRLWCFAAPLAMAACSSSGKPAVPLFSTRDSAGVNIAESNAPAWEVREDGWVLDSTPTLAIPGDSDDGSFYLGAPIAPQLLENGRLLVPDRMGAELFFFDSAGTLVSRVGRRGQGPGEFEAVFNVFRCGHDTLVVQESSRVSLLDSNGHFIRAERVAGRLTEGRGNVEGVLSDCSALLLVNDHVQPPPSGATLHQYSVSLHWASFSGQGRDTVRIFGGGDLMPKRVGEEMQSVRVPFASRPMWVTDGEAVYFGVGDQAEILKLDKRGSLQGILRWEWQRQPVTDGDWQKYDRDLLAFVRENPREAPFRPNSDEVPGRRFMPAFSDIVLDDGGNLWVRRYGPNDYPFAEGVLSENWWIFDPDGRWLGTIRTPAGFGLSSVRQGLAVGIVHGEDGVANIWALRVRKGN